MRLPTPGFPRLHFLIALVSLLLASLIFSRLAGANPVTTAHARAQLLSEVTAVRPGQPFWVALRLTPQEGWHTYWRHPGDSGLATTLAWTLPKGLTASEIHWPYPERIPVGPLMNYGYHGEVLLPVQIQPPESLPDGGPLVLRVRADWLVCQEDCIPEDAVLTLTLPVTTGPAPPDARWTEAFAATRRMLPVPAPWPVSFRVTPETLVLSFAAGPAAERIAALEQVVRVHAQEATDYRTEYESLVVERDRLLEELENNKWEKYHVVPDLEAQITRLGDVLKAARAFMVRYDEVMPHINSLTVLSTIRGAGWDPSWPTFEEPRRVLLAAIEAADRAAEGRD